MKISSLPISAYLLLYLCSIVSATEESELVTGTGFFVSPNGYILTANHVVDSYDQIIIYFEGEVFDCRVVATNVEGDVALLKSEINKSVPFLTMSEKPAKLGQECFTIGFPNLITQGMEPKYTKGEISSEKGLFDDDWSYQISIPVQSGNSGGAVTLMDGEVIGIVSGTLQSDRNHLQNVNYCANHKAFQPLLKFIRNPVEPIEQKGTAIDRVKNSSVLISCSKVKNDQKLDITNVSKPNEPDEKKTTDKDIATLVTMGFLLSGTDHSNFSELNWLSVPCFYFSETMELNEIEKSISEYKEKWTSRFVFIDGFDEILRINKNLWRLKAASTIGAGNSTQRKLMDVVTEFEVEINDGKGRIKSVRSKSVKTISKNDRSAFDFFWNKSKQQSEKYFKATQ